MILFLLATSLSFSTPAAKGDASSQKPERAELSFVSPEDYAIRRFGEVTEAYQASFPNSPQELLIRKRALLQIAEEKLAEERAREGAGGPLSRKNLIRAAEAQVDYYQKVISELEERIKRRRP